MESLNKNKQISGLFSNQAMIGPGIDVNKEQTRITMNDDRTYRSA